MSQIPVDGLYRFYAAEPSYFSAKVRPALRYKRVPFAELLPTPAAYRDVIVPRTGLAFIPILITPENETWQDTSEILDRLEARFPEPPLYPRTPVQRVVTLLWELYCDEFLVLPGLHYRWSFPESEAKARQDFAAFNGAPEAANKFASRIKSFLPFIGVTAETIPHVEAHTHELLAGLEAHFEAHPYLLGSRPSLADCALIGPFYAHLYLDAVPGRLLRERAPRVCNWIERLNHPDPAEDGEWIGGDGLAPTMRPLLELIGRDMVRLMLDDVRDFEAWADQQADRGIEIPRGTGTHTTRLRGVEIPRFTSPYTLWMVQRPLDAYRALQAGERAEVDRALSGTGLEELLAFEPRHRLTKRNFKLAFEQAASHRS